MTPAKGKRSRDRSVGGIIPVAKRMGIKKRSSKRKSNYPMALPLETINHFTCEANGDKEQDFSSSASRNDIKKECHFEQPSTINNELFFLTLNIERWFFIFHFSPFTFHGLLKEL